MKRYWKLIVITIVVILSVGTFYIKSATSASQLPDFVIEKQSGNEKEANPVMINGDYHVGSKYDSLTITSKGTVSLDNQSFFERINKNYLPSDIKKLRKEYRNFMRGKSLDQSSYYEDQHTLAYGNVSYKTLGVSPRDFKFKISMLDKKEKKKTAFQIAVPNESKYENMIVEDVQMVGKQLTIVTQNYNKNDSEKQSEVHAYRFDVTNQKLIANDMILEIAKSDGGYLEMVSSTSPMQPNNYIVHNYQVIHNETQADGSVVDVSSTSEIIAYNLETKTKEVIKLPKELQKSSTVNCYEGSTIYFTEIDEKGVKVSSYDIKTKKINSNFNIQVPQMEKGAEIPLSIKDGKVYILTSYVDVKREASLIIADLKSGSTLYKGKVVEKSGKKDTSEFNLNLYNIELK